MPFADVKQKKQQKKTAARQKITKNRKRNGVVLTETEECVQRLIQRAFKNVRGKDITPYTNGVMCNIKKKEGKKRDLPYVSAYKKRGASRKETEFLWR